MFLRLSLVVRPAHPLWFAIARSLVWMGHLAGV